MAGNSSKRVTSLWSADSTSPLYQKVGVRFHAKMDGRVLQNLEEGLLLAQQREQLVKDLGPGKGLDRYLARIQILTDTGGNRGSHVIKVFLPEIPEAILSGSQSNEDQPDPFDSLGSLFG